MANLDEMSWFDQQYIGGHVERARTCKDVETTQEIPRRPALSHRNAKGNVFLLEVISNH